MKQIILPSTIFEFIWLAIDGFMEENGQAPSPKKEIRSIQKKLALIKNYLLVRGICYGKKGYKYILPENW